MRSDEHLVAAVALQHLLAARPECGAGATI
jgi:hypothetical protein